jgi:hypothetical protein
VARAGGRFADWKAALAEVPLPEIAAAPPPPRQRVVRLPQAPSPA